MSEPHTATDQPAATRADPPPPRRARRGERGVILLGMFTMIMIMAVMSTAAVQEWSILERREREEQLIFIQEQYAAGLLEYQKKQGALPATLDELVKRGGDGTTFMRKAYTDPITRSTALADWCLLQLGAAGRMVSSCSPEAQADQNLGLGSKAGFKVGEDQALRADRQVAGGAQGAGGIGIVGVHSKSADRAYNTLRREEETYDRWYYGIQEYKDDVAARGIPGLPQGQGPNGGNSRRDATSGGTMNGTSGNDNFNNN